jgi:hypothetical protein
MLRQLTFRGVAFLFFCQALAWAGPAAVPDESVNFLVLDQDQHPVAEASVEVRLQDQVVANAVTDATGKAAAELPPGRYVLRVTKKDYIPNESRLDVRPSDSGEKIEVALSHVGLSKQQVTVEGAASNPVEEASRLPAALTPQQAAQTPSRPATVKEALPLVPGVVRDKNGNLAIAGYAESHSTFLVNSVDVTDPSTGDFGLSVPIDSVETINVDEMPYLAQYGKFIAGVVAADTRRGGDKWSFSLNDPLPEFRFRSGHLAGLKDMSPRLNFGGPLIANRLFFSEGAEYLLFKRAVRTLPFPFNETRDFAINSFTQLDAVLSPKHALTATVHISPHSLRYAGLDFFNPQPVTPDASFHESTATVIDRLELGSGVLQSTLAHTYVSSGIFPRSTAEMLLTPMGNQGAYFAQHSRRASRSTWMENWASHPLRLLGEHLLQTGLTLTYSEDEGQLQARPVQIADAAGHLLQRIDFTTGHSFALSDYAPAVFVQDHWILSPQLALDLGVRVEGQTITMTSRTAPRAGFIWTPAWDKKTVLRGGVGIFFDAVPLAAYAFHSYPEQTITPFDPVTGAPGVSTHYFNITEEATRSHCRFVDRGRRVGNFAPYSTAWNLQVEREFLSFLQIRLKYLQSTANDLITLQPEVVSGQNALVLGSSGAARTRQYELTARIGSGQQRQFFFSYVRQFAHGDVNDAGSYTGNYPFPVVRQDLKASLPNEIPNRLLLWGTYALPRKIHLNPHLEVRDGFPYQPVNVLQQYLSTGNSAQSHFPRYFSFDLMVSKDFQITKKHTVRFSVPMLNLTNHFNPLEVHSNLADPQYGTFFGNYQRRVLLEFDVLN